MKKTISTNIAGQLFSIEEDAYEKLDHYLKSIKEHFSHNPDKEEIISDIEARIAEQFIQVSGSARIVTLHHVNDLITSMGKVEDFSQEEAESENPDQPRSVRRLMRNSEDKIIAGVASGIAAYFGIDPLIVRIIFLLTLFASGGGILAYIIFWIIMPEAQTATEKMEMRGDPINLESISSTYAKAGQKKMYVVGNSLGRLIRGLGKIIYMFVRIILGIIAVAVMVAVIFGIVAVTFMAANLLFNTGLPYLESTMSVISNTPLYYVMVFLLYAVILIPLVFIGLFSLGILRRKSPISMTAGLGLLGVWLLVLISSGVIGARFFPEVYHRVQALPENQIVSKTVSVDPFTHLTLRAGDKIRLVKGDTYSIEESGRQFDVERLTTEVKDNVLTIDRNRNDRVCIFCHDKDVTLTITTPRLESLSVQGYAIVESDPFSGKDFTLDVDSYGSAVTLPLELTGTLTVTLKSGAIVNFTGEAELLNLQAQDRAYFFGKEFIVKNALLNMTDDTVANVHATNSLTINASGDAFVIYQGSPKIEENLHDNAFLESAAAADPADNTYTPGYRIRRYYPRHPEMRAE